MKVFGVGRDPKSLNLIYDLPKCPRMKNGHLRTEQKFIPEVNFEGSFRGQESYIFQYKRRTPKVYPKSKWPVQSRDKIVCVHTANFISRGFRSWRSKRLKFNIRSTKESLNSKKKPLPDHPKMAICRITSKMPIFRFTQKWSFY